MNRPTKYRVSRMVGLSGVLSNRDIGGPMPWIVAVMTCLAMLGLAAALTLAPAAASLSGQISGRATIQIVEPDVTARRAAVAAVRNAVRDQPYVMDLRTVPESELAGMASQWLGEGVSETGLPLPALVDVDLVPGDSGAGLARLRSVVSQSVPAARVIAHADWLGPVAGLIRLIGGIAAIIALLLVLAAAAVAMVSARAALAAQRPTIDVLHMVGATDVQIARLFQRRTARDVLAGVALGGVFALAIVLGVAWQMQGVVSGLVGDAPAPLHFLWLLLVPPLVLAVAVVTARIAVLRALRRMP
ncbi:cell division protein [Sphingomonas lacunae]|uniref:Cell division protein n=1 Tax=Sphingomonas lacunae TaxID=2698828 RepID=A0A6M4AUV2_9SPHN|nr:cell division protein [Sphingomonas lacunae]QJQ31849.1 cell division protein [Sphingomonas lacunae]